MKLVSRLGLVGALAMSACTADYASNDNAPVLLIVASINGGSVMHSDVGGGSAGVCPDIVEVAVANRSKNPNAPTPVIPMHLLLNRYEVRYFRSDGRSTQGVDVPYSISGALASEVDVANSGTTSVPVQVVRAQAKLEPPLIQLRNAGGQALIVSMFAEVTIYGQTVAGQVAKASGTMQIDFANYGSGCAS
jgi:hypothetical protein